MQPYTPDTHSNTPETVSDGVSCQTASEPTPSFGEESLAKSVSRILDEETPQPDGTADGQPLSFGAAAADRASSSDGLPDGDNAEADILPQEKGRRRNRMRRRRRKLPADIFPNYPLTGPEGKKCFLVLCFVVPFVLLLVGFAYMGLYPFANRQILIMDAWHQYYPFFEELVTRIRSGESVLFSFTSGMGTNLIALFAYYLASPLNLLALLVPTDFLREIYALITLLKVAFAGLFAGIYIYKVFKRNDITVPMFASCFALCSFMMGYYWNIMWLDTVMLLPLLALGIHRLVTEGRFKMYTLILALSVAANYYIGFIVCLFTAFYFFILCIVNRIGFKKFFVRFGQIALFSIIGLAMTAPITLTAYDALMHAYYVPEEFTGTIKLYHSYWEIVTQVLAFIPPTYSDGLPNLYCGFFCFLMLYVFLRTPKIRIREKVLYVLFLAFLIVSCNVNLLNYIWHGLHYPNMLPYRFSFLFSFLVVTMAYKAFQYLSDLRWFDLVIMFLLYGFFLLIAVQTLGIPTAIYNAIAFLVYFVMLAVYVKKRWVDPEFRQKTTELIGVAMLVEFTIYVFITMEQVGSSSRSSYVNKEAEMDAFLEQIEQTDDELFYRTEFSTWYILNGSSIYDFNGVAQFSSTANSGVSWALKSLGLASSPSGNRFTYGATSPIANAFINLKYILSASEPLADTYAYEELNAINDSTLYKTTSYLPLGFMVNSEVDTLKTNAQTPFDRQNEWIREQTGIRADVFERIPLKTVGHSSAYVPTLTDGRYAYMTRGTSAGRIKFNYTVPETTEVFAYVDLPGYDSITYLEDNAERTAEELALNGSTVFSFGEIEADTTISLRKVVQAPTSGLVNVSVYTLNQEAYNQALETLTREEIITISPDYYYDVEIADNPLEFQNSLLSLASGVEEKAMTSLTPEGISYENVRFFHSDIAIYGFESIGGKDKPGTITLNYTMPRDGSLYIMVDIDDVKDDDVTITCGDQEFRFNCHYPYVVAAGTYSEGSLVSMSFTLEENASGTLQARAYLLEEDVFEEALSELTDEPLLLTRMDEDIIEGTVTAKQDGYLYTSVPYEEGWKAYVDGERTEIVPFGDDGFVMIPVTEGTHTIRLIYVPSGFLPGLALFAGAAVLFAFCVWVDTRKKKTLCASTSEACAE